ncbi:MAG: PEP-CTERM sorting domain-containing protein [Verrucomicrobiota bacterium]
MSVLGRLRNTLTRTTLTGIVASLSVSPVMGVMTVHFVEESGGLRVSFSGSLDLTGAGVFSDGILRNTTGIFTAQGVTLPGAFDYDHEGPSIGSSTFLTPDDGLGTQILPTPDSNVLGFYDGGLWWSAVHVTGGTELEPTELTADPFRDTVFFGGKSLTDIGAQPGDIAEGTVLWTANVTGDTFVFSRTVPVPEPSSFALLFGLATSLALLRRRSRRG